MIEKVEKFVSDKWGEDMAELLHAVTEHHLTLEKIVEVQDMTDDQDCTAIKVIQGAMDDDVEFIESEAIRAFGFDAGLTEEEFDSYMREVMK